MAWAAWVTGLPGSGKTTIANITADILRAKDMRVKVLNIDDVRKVLTPNATYSLEERAIVYAAMAYMAKLLVEEGVNVIIDATGNLRQYRDVARKLIPDFVELYVKCPLNVAIEREEARRGSNAPKDIYKKGMTGKSSTVPGVNVVYEPPETPLVTLDTEKLSAADAGALAADLLMAHFGEAYV
jgi:adenylylsulfate kinase